MSNLSRNCFTYWVKLVSKLDQSELFYYGSKTARLCDPSDLGSTYFTSSKHVIALINAGEHDVEWHVHRVFGEDHNACVSHEGDMIQWLMAHKSGTWLNRYSPKERRLGMDGVKFSREHAAKISAALTGVRMSDAARKKMSESAKKRRGRFMSPEARAKIAESLRGRKHTDERRANESAAHKARFEKMRRAD